VGLRIKEFKDSPENFPFASQVEMAHQFLCIKIRMVMPDSRHDGRPSPSNWSQHLLKLFLIHIFGSIPVGLSITSSRFCVCDHHR
jgi:hypothetical protein